MNEIEKFRNEIDKIDELIIENLIKRKIVSDKIIAIKKSKNKAVYDKQREQKIINSLIDKYHNFLDPQYISTIFEDILFFSKAGSYNFNTGKSNNLIELLDSSPILIPHLKNSLTNEKFLKLIDIFSKKGIRILQLDFPEITERFALTKALNFIKETAKKNNMFITYEFDSSSQFNEFSDIPDIIKLTIGKGDKYNFLIENLKNINKTDKPLILERGAQSTYEDLIKTAEHLTEAGFSEIILCLDEFLLNNDHFTNNINTAGIYSAAKLKKLSNIKILIKFSSKYNYQNHKELIKESAEKLVFYGLIVNLNFNELDADSSEINNIIEYVIDKIISFFNSDI